MFFAHDSGLRPREAPRHMLLSMGITAFLCVLIGVYPKILYGLLPFSIDYLPYTFSHVLTQLQLLFFSALAFTILLRYGFYPPELKSVNLDSDWLYRRLIKSLINNVSAFIGNNWNFLAEKVETNFEKFFFTLYHFHKPNKTSFWIFQSNSIIFRIIVFLGLILLLSIF